MDPETPGARRVLIVEDHDDSRAVMRMLLTQLGWHAAEAADGYAAVTVAVNLKPHLVLLDVGLPGLDGVQVAETLRAVLGPSVYLVGVSGYRHEGAAPPPPFDRYLVKPVSYEDLARVCEQVPEPPVRGPDQRAPGCLPATW